jgi:hypothetical protein
LASFVGIQRLKRVIKSKLGTEVIKALVGDADGDVRASREGYIKVRLLASNGLFTRPAEARRPITNVNLQPGIMVDLIQDTEGQYAIRGVTFSGSLAQARDPALANASDVRVWRFIPQNNLLTGYCQIVGVPAGLVVGVKTWAYIYNGQWYKINDTIDLTSLLPSSGKHRVALVYVDANNALQAAGSTEKDVNIPLDKASLTDLQSAYDAATNLLAPVWFWYLTNGLTALDGRDYPEGNSLLDARQMVGMDWSSCQMPKPQPSTLYDYTLKSCSNLTLAGHITFVGRVVVEGYLKII